MGHMYKKKETQAFIDDYKGSKVFAIWHVNESGNKVGDYPITSFGISKAKEILKHLSELEAFVEDKYEL